jgi:hypothetical protein
VKTIVVTRETFVPVVFLSVLCAPKPFDIEKLP